MEPAIYTGEYLERVQALANSMAVALNNIHWVIQEERRSPEEKQRELNLMGWL